VNRLCSVWRSLFTNVYKCDIIGRNEYLISTLSESTIPQLYSQQFLFKSTHHTWRYERKCEWGGCFFWTQCILYSGHVQLSRKYRMISRIADADGVWVTPVMMRTLMASDGACNVNTPMTCWNLVICTMTKAFLIPPPVATAATAGRQRRKTLGCAPPPPPNVVTSTLPTHASGTFCVEQMSDRELAEPWMVEIDMWAVLPLAQPRYCHQSPTRTRVHTASSLPATTDTDIAFSSVWCQRGNSWPCEMSSYSTDAQT